MVRRVMLSSWGRRVELSVEDVVSLVGQVNDGDVDLGCLRAEESVCVPRRVRLGCAYRRNVLCL